MSVQGSRNPASSTSSSTTNQMRTDSDNDKVEVNRPDTYHGDRNKLDSWLIQFDTYSALNQVPKGKRTLFASTFLRDETRARLKPQLQEYLDSDRNQDELESLDQLVKASIELSDELYEQAMKERNSMPHGRFGTYGVFGESYRTQGSVSEELDLTRRRKGKNPRVKQGNRRKACYKCDRTSHFAKDCPKGLMFQRQINATLREILEAKMEWEEASGISSNEEDYCLIDNSSKVLTVLEEPTLKAIAPTKPLNSNSNIVVTKLPKTYPSQYEEDSELEEEFHQVEKLNPKRTVYEQIIDNLKRILDSNASKEREISTRRLEDLLDLTVCDECPYMSYRTCTYWKCEEHILKEVAKRRNNNNHEVLD